MGKTLGGGRGNSDDLVFAITELQTAHTHTKKWILKILNFMRFREEKQKFWEGRIFLFNVVLNKSKKKLNLRIKIKICIFSIRRETMRETVFGEGGFR